MGQSKGDPEDLLVKSTQVSLLTRTPEYFGSYFFPSLNEAKLDPHQVSSCTVSPVSTIAAPHASIGVYNPF